MSIPENKINKIRIQIEDHMNLYDNYKKNELELKILKENKLKIKK